MAKPVQVKEVVGSFLKKLNRNNKITLDDLEDFFKKTLDKRILCHIKFVNLKEGTLKVKVDSSAWLCELTLRKPQILGDLQEKFSDKIKDIKFFIGEL